MCFFFQILWATSRRDSGCASSYQQFLSYYEGCHNMFKILRPNRTYYLDNIVAPSAYISTFFDWTIFTLCSALISISQAWSIIDLMLICSSLWNTQGSSINDVSQTFRILSSMLFCSKWFTNTSRHWLLLESFWFCEMMCRCLSQINYWLFEMFCEYWYKSRIN